MIYDMIYSTAIG